MERGAREEEQGLGMVMVMRGGGTEAAWWGWGGGRLRKIQY